MNVPTGPTPTVQNITTAMSRTTISVILEFKKGIKRDKAHYTILKDEKQWDNWKRKTAATVYAHGCENIISNTYVPSTSDEMLLFEEQNKFMYDVFITIIQTHMGKHFLRQHENTWDAQLVWRDYVGYMRTSTCANIVIEDFMTALTSRRLYTNYKGTTQEFIVN